MLGDLWFFPVFSKFLFCILLVFFKKCSLRSRDIFQYVLDHFWNFQKLRQIWTFSLLFLCRNASRDTRKLWKHHQQLLVFISQQSGLPKFCHFLKRRAPKRPEDLSNKIFKDMDMRPISIKKHEWIFANMIPISITKHKMRFFGISQFL